MEKQPLQPSSPWHIAFAFVMLLALQSAFNATRTETLSYSEFKTLLAKAVAGEADVPFFSMSGSEFV